MTEHSVEDPSKVRRVRSLTAYFEQLSGPESTTELRPRAPGLSLRTARPSRIRAVTAGTAAPLAVGAGTVRTARPSQIRPSTAAPARADGIARLSPDPDPSLIAPGTVASVPARRLVRVPTAATGEPSGARRETFGSSPQVSTTRPSPTPSIRAPDATGAFIRDLVARGRAAGAITVLSSARPSNPVIESIIEESIREL